MSVKLRIRPLAEERGLNISTFQRAAGIPMSTARRLWYSTSNGKEEGSGLRSINLDTLETLSAFFKCGIGDLFVITGKK